MSSVAVTVEKQARRGRRKVLLKFNPGQRSVVCDLVARRADLTMRLVGLEAEYNRAVQEIQRIEEMLQCP